ncbi:putative transport protein [Photorhabdus asymbiotica]|uniref:Transport protein n=2 Tax=Photorhabdus asymbiotica TaxID=291112 RepID=C7BK32_PHOAA|nr:YNFM family putative membrane transporter [Photorhabdus asymbiotica]CAQ84272.1 putative transport protein [Photorhabdus asymbiotica]
MSTIHNISENQVSGNNFVQDIQNEKNYIQKEDPLYIRVTLSLFTVGFASFALLYFIQPILPMLSEDFGVSPATSSLSLSLSTGMLALGLLITGPLSDAIGRKNIMVTALFTAAFFTLLSALMTSWYGILVVRVLVGLSLSGVAAVAMTYLSEEIHPNFTALSMGLYISGNSIGGMSGRLISGIITDYFSWRISVIVLGLFALIAAIIFCRMLPKSCHFRPSSLKPKSLLINLKLLFRDKGLPLLFSEAFLLMGSFITVFNYIGYRLLDSPYHFSQSTVGILSIVYLAGTYSASKVGALTSKYGLGKVLIATISMMLVGIFITILSSAVMIIIGIMVLTSGFFAAHAVASSWVGLRARRAKAQASSLYLFCYYAGSSVAGTFGGIFWLQLGWNGVVLFITILILLALFFGFKLIKLPEAK